MVDCLPCAAGHHESCWVPSAEDCCCPATYWDMQPELTIAEALTGGSHGITDGRSEQGRGGQVKDPDAVTDTESTGRKRAAKLFPIEPGMPCEWAGLKLAGGGVQPIMGCIPEGRNAATDIHHGPNKSTLANLVGNVHRICSTCHNRWHTVNDRFYNTPRPAGMYWWPLEEYDVYEHLPFVYPTDQERAANEIAWVQGKANEFLVGLIETEKDKLKSLTHSA